MLTDSGIHSLWSFCSLECHWSVFWSCSVTRAFASLSAITRRGYVRAKSSSKPICAALGARIRWRSWDLYSRKKVQKRYTRNGSVLTNLFCFAWFGRGGGEIEPTTFGLKVRIRALRQPTATDKSQ